MQGPKKGAGRTKDFYQGEVALLSIVGQSTTLDLGVGLGIEN